MSELAADKQLAHMVYFTLKDATDGSRQALVDSCHKFLTAHTGAVYFSAGTRAPDFQRPVNDGEFDVALHVVFESREAHDSYQESPRHQEFIAANKDNWKQVRVFDSYV